MTDQTARDIGIRAHVEALLPSIDLAELKSHFKRHGYVKLPRLVPDEIYSDVKAEILDLIERDGVRIDLEIKETGSTPRKMRTASRDAIFSGSKAVRLIYGSPSIRGFLAELAGEELFDCPWRHEQYVAIRQTEPGDTHGWHWGDYAFTVIWILEAPDDISVGGALQCIPNTKWDKTNPRLDYWLGTQEPDTWNHLAGDAYFLRSDTTLHRTIPLREASQRTILNTCWASADARTVDQESHETMVAMFTMDS